MGLHSNSRQPQPATLGPGKPASECERLARAALEKRYGRALPDTEWESVKRDLITFVRLLREWERRTGSASSELPAGVSNES